jgi:hypothetical protein
MDESSFRFVVVCYNFVCKIVTSNIVVMGGNGFVCFFFPLPLVV